MMVDMGEVVLIRHGETEWSLSGRHTGTTDLPLTAHGEEQARALRAALAGQEFAMVLTSPRQRARRTAELAGLTSAEVDADLAEWDYGAYEGRTTAEISAELGRPWTVFADGVPSGETVDEVGARADRVLARIRATVERGGIVALVAHAHVLRVVGARWLGLPPGGGAMLRLDAASVSRLDEEHGRPVISLWNARAS
jgi:broad specificity phosphatase PhoE